MLNKPRGYVSTLKDPEGRRLVTDLVENVPERLFPVGRLDYNTEGLLLLTNDGDLAQHLSHPRNHVDKTYLVKVRGDLSRSLIQRLETGIELEDGMTAAAKVSNVRGAGPHCWFELTIHEGRNRQVRRMCEKLGLSVLRLKRIQLGFLTLGELKSGSFRHLSSAETRKLKQIILIFLFIRYFFLRYAIIFRLTELELILVSEVFVLLDSYIGAVLPL